jgi:hypothetical protein
LTTYGITPAGFAIKPFAAILSDIQNAELATMDAALDLAPTGPLGQLNGIMANALSQLWEILATCYNSNNRQAAEGAALDNIGDEVGVPRELASYTQVLCTLTFSGTSVYPPGTLVANVNGNTALAFSNLVQITGAPTVTGAIFQAHGHHEPRQRLDIDHEPRCAKPARDERGAGRGLRLAPRRGTRGRRYVQSLRNGGCHPGSRSSAEPTREYLGDGH